MSTMTKYVLDYRLIVTNDKSQQYWEKSNYVFDIIKDKKELIKEILEGIRILRKFLFRNSSPNDCAFIKIDYLYLIVRKDKIEYVDNTKFFHGGTVDEMIEGTITLKDIKAGKLPGVQL